jgi:hypothetical protein
MKYFYTYEHCDTDENGFLNEPDSKTLTIYMVIAKSAKKGVVEALKIFQDNNAHFGYYSEIDRLADGIIISPNEQNRNERVEFPLERFAKMKKSDSDMVFAEIYR